MSGKLKIDESFKEKLSCILSGKTYDAPPLITPVTNIPPPPPLISTVNIPAPPPLITPVTIPQVQPIHPHVDNTIQHQMMNNMMSMINDPLSRLLKLIVDEHIQKNNKEPEQEPVYVEQEVKKKISEVVVKKPLQLPNTLHQIAKPYNHGFRLRKM